jgi:Protein of unknown function (DUF3617)
MNRLRYLLSGLILVAAVQMASAQTKFPERAGEWEVKTSSSLSPTANTTSLFCLNDETWQKGLTQNRTCSIHDVSVTSRGASYSMDCAGKTYQMKGSTELTFDGPEHMTAKTLIEMSMNGKSSNSTSTGDYRWKGATCSPDDANMKPRPH